MGWNIGGMLGTKNDYTVPNAAKNYWISSMAAINNLLGPNGAFGTAGRERAKASFAEQMWNAFHGNAQNQYSLADQGITPSGANFGMIRTNQAIAGNNRDVEQNYNQALLSGLFQQNQLSNQGFGDVIQGKQGWLLPLLSAGAGIAGSLGWNPLGKKH